MTGLLGSVLLFIQQNIVGSCSPNMPQISRGNISYIHNISADVVFFKCTEMAYRHIFIGGQAEYIDVSSQQLSCSKSSVMTPAAYNEQMHLIQRAWLQGIASLQCLGWQLLVAKYWQVSHGFTYRSVTIRPSTIFTVVSKNDTLSVDHSVVNLRVGVLG